MTVIGQQDLSSVNVYPQENVKLRYETLSLLILCPVSSLNAALLKFAPFSKNFKEYSKPLRENF